MPNKHPFGYLLNAWIREDLRLEFVVTTIDVAWGYVDVGKEKQEVRHFSYPNKHSITAYRFQGCWFVKMKYDGSDRTHRLRKWGDNTPYTSSRQVVAENQISWLNQMETSLLERACAA